MITETLIHGIGTTVVLYRSDLARLPLNELLESLNSSSPLTQFNKENNIGLGDSTLSDSISKSRMDEELKQTEDRTRDVERQLEDLRAEREELVRRASVIRSARDLFFSDQTKSKTAPQPGPSIPDNDLLRVVTGIEADTFQHLTIGQAVLAVLRENGNKWTTLAEFEVEFKKRGKTTGYNSLDQTIRDSKITERLESKKENNRNYFRLKQ
jgi:hypothetical protein